MAQQQNFYYNNFPSQLQSTEPSFIDPSLFMNLNNDPMLEEQDDLINFQPSSFQQDGANSFHEFIEYPQTPYHNQKMIVRGNLNNNDFFENSKTKQSEQLFEDNCLQQWQKSDVDNNCTFYENQIVQHTNYYEINPNEEKGSKLFTMDSQDTQNQDKIQLEEPFDNLSMNSSFSFFNSQDYYSLKNFNKFSNCQNYQNEQLQEEKVINQQSQQQSIIINNNIYFSIHNNNSSLKSLKSNNEIVQNSNEIQQNQQVEEQKEEMKIEQEEFAIVDEDQSLNDHNLQNIRAQAQNERKFVSLAHRNIKMNFGTGLIQYIELIVQKKQLSRSSDLSCFQDLFSWVLKHQQGFRSFNGWQELWLDPTYGTLLRKVCLQYFSPKNSFASMYVEHGNIKSEYKQEYLKKINKFFQGAKNPKTFNAFAFKV